MLSRFRLLLCIVLALAVAQMAFARDPDGLLKKLFSILPSAAEKDESGPFQNLDERRAPSEAEMKKQIGDFFCKLTGWPAELLEVEVSKDGAAIRPTKSSGKSHLTLYFEPNFIAGLESDDALALILRHEFNHEVSTDFIHGLAEDIQKEAPHNEKLAKILKWTVGKRQDTDSIRNRIQTEFSIGLEFYSDVQAAIDVLKDGYRPEAFIEVLKGWLGDDKRIAKKYAISSHPLNRDRIHALEAVLTWAKSHKELAPYAQKDAAFKTTRIAPLQALGEKRQEITKQYFKDPAALRHHLELMKESWRSFQESEIGKLSASIDYFFKTERDHSAVLKTPETMQTPGFYENFTPDFRNELESAWKNEAKTFERAYESARVDLVRQKMPPAAKSSAEAVSRYKELETFGSRTSTLRIYGHKNPYFLAGITQIEEDAHARRLELFRSATLADLLAFAEESRVAYYIVEARPELAGELKKAWKTFSNEERRRYHQLFQNNFPPYQVQHIDTYLEIIQHDPAMAVDFFNVITSNHKELSKAQKTELSRVFNETFAKLSAEDFESVVPHVWNDFFKGMFFERLRESEFRFDRPQPGLSAYLARRTGSRFVDAYLDYPELRPVISEASEAALQWYLDLLKTPAKLRSEDFPIYGLFRVLNLRAKLKELPTFQALQKEFGSLIEAEAKVLSRLPEEDFNKEIARLWLLANDRMPLDHVVAKQYLQSSEVNRFMPSFKNLGEYLPAFAALDMGHRNAELRARIKRNAVPIFVELIHNDNFHHDPARNKRVRLAVASAMPRSQQLEVLREVMKRNASANEIHRFKRYFPQAITVAEVESLGLEGYPKKLLMSNIPLSTPEILAHIAPDLEQARSGSKEHYLERMRDLSASISANQGSEYWPKHATQAISAQILGEARKRWPELVREMTSQSSAEDFQKQAREIFSRDPDRWTSEWADIQYSAFPLLEERIAKEDLQFQLEYLKGAKASRISSAFRETVYARFIKSDLPYSEKLPHLRVVADQDLAKMNECWDKIVFPELKKNPEGFDATKTAAALKLTYGDFYDAKARKIDVVAQHFKLQPPEIERLETLAFPNEDKGQAYKEVQLFQAAVKRLFAEDEPLLSNTEMIETLRWLQGKREEPPKLIHKISDTITRALRDSRKVELITSLILESFRENPVAVRMAMISDFVSPLHDQSLWHPKNLEGRQALVTSLLEGLGKDHEPLARVLVDSLSEGMDMGREPRSHHLAAQLVAGSVQRNSASSDIEKARDFFEAKGGLWAKIGQLLGANPNLIPKESDRRVLQTLNDKAGIPTRKAIFQMLKESMGSEFEKVKQVHEVLGAGSINASFVVEMKSGKRFVARLVKGDPDNLALYDKDDIQNAAKILRGKSESGIRGVDSRLAHSIAGALDEYSALLTDSMQREADLNFDREAYKILRPDSMAGGARNPYGSYYGDLNVRVDLVGEALDVIEYGEGKAKASRLMLFPIIHDARKAADPKLQPTPEEVLRAQKAMLRSELEAFFTHGRFDPDGHLGNWLMEVEGPERKIKVSRIDTSQALELPKNLRENFKGLIQGLTRRSQPALLTVRKRGDAELLNHFLALIDSNVERSRLEKIALEAFDQLPRKGENSNPLRFMNDWKAKVQEKLARGTEVLSFKAPVQMAMKSLFLTQQLLEVPQGHPDPKRAATAMRAFQLDEFSRLALEQNRLERALIQAGHRLQGIFAGPPDALATDANRETIRYVREKLLEKPINIDITEGDYEKLLRLFPDLKADLMAHAERVLKEVEYRNLPHRQYWEKETDYSRQVRVEQEALESAYHFSERNPRFADITAEALETKSAELVIETILENDMEGAYDALYNHLAKSLRAILGAVAERVYVGESWRDYFSERLKGDPDFPIGHLLNSTVLKAYPGIAESIPHRLEGIQLSPFDGLYIDLKEYNVEFREALANAYYRYFENLGVLDSKLYISSIPDALWEHPRLIEVLPKIREASIHPHYLQDHILRHLKYGEVSVEQLENFVARAPKREALHALEGLAVAAGDPARQSAARSALRRLADSHANAGIRRRAQLNLAGFERRPALISEGGRPIEPDSKGTSVFVVDNKKNKTLLRRFERKNPAHLGIIAALREANALAYTGEAAKIQIVFSNEFVKKVGTMEAASHIYGDFANSEMMREAYRPFDKKLSNEEWKKFGLLVEREQDSRPPPGFSEALRRALSHQEDFSSLDARAKRSVDTILREIGLPRLKLLEAYLSSPLTQHLDRLARGDKVPTLRLSMDDIADLSFLIEHQEELNLAVMRRSFDHLFNKSPQHLIDVIRTLSFQDEATRQYFSEVIQNTTEDAARGWKKNKRALARIQEALMARSCNDVLSAAAKAAN
jgi:hypothetical protein